MPLGDGTRESAEAALDRLRERYGEIPTTAVTVENDPDYFEHGVAVAEAGELAGAGAWVEDGDGRVLFIRHPDSPDDWGVPGGGVEPGETLAGTATREVREETGVDVQVTDVWKVRHRTIVHRDDRDRRLHTVDAWFDAVPVADDPATHLDESALETDEEILEARWFERPPESVHDPFEERVASWGTE